MHATYINLGYSLKIRNKTGIKNLNSKLKIETDQMVTLGLFPQKFHSKIKRSEKKIVVFFLGLIFWFSCKISLQHWCEDTAKMFLGNWQTSFNCRFFLNRSPVCFNLFVLLFLVTPCLIVTFQPCMEWIPIKKNLI